MSKILPPGMPDYLPEESKNHYDIIKKLLTIFTLHDYEYIEPPLCEYASSYGQNLSSTLLKQTFTFIDPLSNELLVLRSDITPQITRIIEQKLHHHTQPIRLCYGGDILRVKASQYRFLRQFKQVGVELISSQHHQECDQEILLLMMYSLQQIGIKNVTIDLAYPSIIYDIIKQLPISIQQDATNYIIKREKQKIQNITNLYPQAQLLNDILSLCGPIDYIIEKSQHIQHPQIHDIINYIKNIYHSISAISGVNISLDLGGYSKLSL